MRSCKLLFGFSNLNMRIIMIFVITQFSYHHHPTSSVAMKNSKFLPICTLLCLVHSRSIDVINYFFRNNFLGTLFLDALKIVPEPLGKY